MIPDRKPDPAPCDYVLYGDWCSVCRKGHKDPK